MEHPVEVMAGMVATALEQKPALNIIVTRTLEMPTWVPTEVMAVTEVRPITQQEGKAVMAASRKLTELEVWAVVEEKIETMTVLRG